MNNLCMKNVIFILSLFNVLYAQQEITQFTGSLKDGLIGYWPFNTNEDLSGNGNYARIHGAIPAKDRFGTKYSSYKFDGIDDYINLGNNNIFNSNNISLSIWFFELIKPLEGTTHTILSKSTSIYNQIGYRIETSHDMSTYFVQSQMGIIKSGTGFIKSPPVTLNTWTNIVISKNGPNVQMYKNGRLVNSNNNLYSLINNNNDLIIGATTDFNIRTGFFNGLIDDVAIWNRALTTEEIKSIYEFDPSINTKLIQTSKDEYQGNKISLNSKNKQDSLARLIPTQSQNSVYKLVKALSKAESQKRLNSSINNLYNYFFLGAFNQNQTIDFVREIQYFVNLAKTDNNFYKYFESEITNFVDSANNYLNNRILRDFKSSIPQVESYSELWMNLLEIECYPWVKIDTLHENFISLVQQPVVNIYFQRLQTVENIKAQNELIVDFKTHFPKMNEDIDVIDFIIFRIDHEQCSGKFKLFNHNFFEYWVVGEGDPLQDIPRWLARNENDEKEIASIYTNLNDSISLWQFSLCRNTLCGITEVYKNNQLYFQMQFEGSDYAYFSDRNYPNLVRVYENSAKTKEVYFNGSKRYSIYFKNGINITEKDISDTLGLATNFAKLPEPEFEKALALISSLEWHRFPDSLDLKKQIDSTKYEIESLFSSWKINRINTLMVESQLLVNNNKFKESREKLKGALELCSDETITCGQINIALIEIEHKEKLYFEGLDKIDIIQTLNKSKVLKTKTSYDEAIELLQQILIKYSEKKYAELDTVQIEITELKNLKLIFENEKKEARLKENLKNLIQELDFTKIGQVEISKKYLSSIHFTNGEPLFYARSAEEFARKTIEKTPVYCYYNFDEKYAEKGIYYNMYALHDLAGRKLFPDELRLPFQSEIVYSYAQSRKMEAKKASGLQKEFANYIYNPNELEKFNGYNMLKYENATFNFYKEKFNPSKLKEPYRGYGQFGLNDYPDEMRHMFWTIPDFDFEDEKCTVSPNFFSCDFQNLTQTAYVTFSICEIAKKRNYYNDEDVIFSNTTSMNELTASRTEKKEFILIAAQVKLVKQRPILKSDDWLSNSNSKKLIKKTYDYINGNKREFVTYPAIEYATNEYQWRDFDNKEIPACMSFKFDSKNDTINGVLYNRFCFSEYSYYTFPFVKNSRPMDLFELSNTKYKIKGDETAFWNFLIKDLKLNKVIYSSWDDKNKEQLFSDLNRGRFMYTDNFAVNKISLNRYQTSNDNEYFISSFSRNDYSEERNLGFSTDAFHSYFQDNFLGISIKYLKNNK